MNRRSFFKSLSAAVVGCYVALHVKLEDVKAVINPDWVTASHEVYFITNWGCGEPENIITYKRSDYAGTSADVDYLWR
jgi:hypothetical protein